MMPTHPGGSNTSLVIDDKFAAALVEGARKTAGIDSVETKVASRISEKLRLPPAPAATEQGTEDEVDEQSIRLRFQAQRLAMCKLGRGLPVSSNLLQLAQFGPRQRVTAEQKESALDRDQTGAATGGHGIQSSEQPAVVKKETVELIEECAAAMTESGSATEEERKESVHRKIQNRISEILAVLDDLPHEEKLKALLELKQLQQYELQVKLRRQVLVEKWISDSCTPNLLLDWSRLRAGPRGSETQELPLYLPQPPKPLPVRRTRAEVEAEVIRCREAEEKREQDLQEQRLKEAQAARLQQAIEADKKRKYEEEQCRIREYEARQQAVAKRREFLDDMIRTFNARVQLAAARDNPTKRKQQRNLAVKSWHTKEKRNAERVASARVVALKAHNYEEYLRLAKNAKDDRLRTLLNKTDAIMHELGMKIKTQRRAGAGEVEIVEDDDWEREREGLDDAERLIQGQQNYYGLVHQVKEKINDQPTILSGGTLRSYQMDGLKFLVSLFNNKMNGILADEMGLGKTVQTVGMLAYLLEYKQNKGPHLILAPKAVLSNWQNEFDKWLPGLVAITYDGTPDERKNLRQEYIDKGNFNAIVTHYDLAIRDKAVFKKINWEVLIVDEGHRLKNAESKLFSLLSSYSFKTRLLLTGTPVQNSLNELWALLNFLLPKVFHSSETFDEWFAAPFKGQSEDVVLQEEEQLLIINRLHQVIRPFMLRRTKNEVAKELPSKTEHIIKCDMSAWQKLLYRQITAEGQVMHESGKIKRLANLSMHLRKACNHPYLMCDPSYYSDDPEEIIRASGKLELLDRVLPKLFNTGHRVLLFSQMTRALDMVEEFLSYRKYKFLRLDGSTKTEERASKLADFNKEGSEYFIFMLSTRAGGLGLNLQTADTVIMFDSDWNPAMDQQAEDRAHRIGQKKEVLVLILVSAGTIEEDILDKAHKKRDIDAKVIQAGMFNDKSTNSERQQALEAILRRGGLHLAGHLTSDEEINEKLARSEEEFAFFEQMDVQYRAAQTPGRARLLTEEELPKWVTQPEPQAATEKEMEEAQDEADGRRSRRAKKNIFYADPLNDAEFEKLMMSGATEEDMDMIREINRAELVRKREKKPGGGRATPTPKRRRTDDGEEDMMTNGDSAVTHSRKTLRPMKSTRSSSKVDDGLSESEISLIDELYDDDDEDDDVLGTPLRGGVTLSEAAQTRGEVSEGAQSAQEESAMSEVQTPSKSRGRGRGRLKKVSGRGNAPSEPGWPPGGAAGPLNNAGTYNNAGTLNDNGAGATSTVDTGGSVDMAGRTSRLGGDYMEGVEQGAESVQETVSSSGRGRGRGRRGRPPGRGRGSRRGGRTGQEETGQQYNGGVSSPAQHAATPSPQAHIQTPGGLAQHASPAQNAITPLQGAGRVPGGLAQQSSPTNNASTPQHPPHNNTAGLGLGQNSIPNLNLSVKGQPGPNPPGQILPSPNPPGPSQQGLIQQGPIPQGLISQGPNLQGPVPSVPLASHVLGTPTLHSTTNSTAAHQHAQVAVPIPAGLASALAARGFTIPPFSALLNSALVTPLTRAPHTSTPLPSSTSPPPHPQSSSPVTQPNIPQSHAQAPPPTAQTQPPTQPQPQTQTQPHTVPLPNPVSSTASAVPPFPPQHSQPASALLPVHPAHSQPTSALQGTYPVQALPTPPFLPTNQAQSQSIPASSPTLPVHSQSNPAVQLTYPAHRQSVPSASQAPPAHSQSIPAGQPTPPAHSQSIPARQSTHPVQSQSTPSPSHAPPPPQNQSIPGAPHTQPGQGQQPIPAFLSTHSAQSPSLPETLLNVKPGGITRVVPAANNIRPDSSTAGAVTPLEAKTGGITRVLPAATISPDGSSHSISPGGGQGPVPPQLPIATSRPPVESAVVDPHEVVTSFMPASSDGHIANGAAAEKEVVAPYIAGSPPQPPENGVGDGHEVVKSFIAASRPGAHEAGAGALQEGVAPFIAVSSSNPLESSAGAQQQVGASYMPALETGAAAQQEVVTPFMTALESVAGGPQEVATPFMTLGTVEDPSLYAHLGQTVQAMEGVELGFGQMQTSSTPGDFAQLMNEPPDASSYELMEWLADEQDMGNSSVLEAVGEED